MSFVVSEGKLTTLERPSPPAVRRVELGLDFAADYAELWRTQPQVRTVVGFLARNIAQLGLHTFQRVSDTDRKRLTDHPLPRLFAKPNPRTTRYRLIDGLVNDLGIYDVACWAKIRPAGGDPAGLLRLPPSQIAPTGDSWAWPEGIKFRGSRGETTLSMDDVVLFRGYSPTDSRWGVSPMETLRRILAEEYQAGQYREQLWRNGARFPGHIRRPKDAPKWSDPARERFRADWRGLYTGNGPGAGGTPLLEDGMEFHPNGITPEQAQYLETRKLTREEVASAFHIPLPMVGILDHATFSNIEEQHKQLYQDTLGPWLTMIQEEIGLQLVPEFDQSGSVYVEFNMAEKLKGSFEEQAGQLQTAVGAPWLTRNEARARQNLPQIDGGDDLVVPLNVLIGGQASPTDSAPPKHAAPLAKSRAPETHERKYAEVLVKFFRRQRAAVTSILGAKADRDWWDEPRWNKELGADLLRLGLLTSVAAAKAVLDRAGIDPDSYSEDRTLAYLTAYAAAAAERINAKTRDAIAATLDSDDPDVGHVFDVAESSRANALAVATVTAMSAFGAREAGSQNGAKSKTWVTGPNARPEHAAMDGETVALADDFSNGMPWPGAASGDADDIAGCNCSLKINFQED